MLLAQVAVGFHGQRAAVRVSQPARDGRNVYPALYAAGCEEVTEVVMGHLCHPDCGAGRFKRPQAPSDFEDWSRRRFFASAGSKLAQ